MRGLFASRALRWSAIFLISSVAASHQARRLWDQADLAKAELQASRERARSADDEVARLKRIVGAMADAGEPSETMHERLALLARRLRATQARTRVSIKTVVAEGSAGDSRSEAAIARPLARIHGAIAMGVVVEGTYSTLDGLEEFLNARSAAGAALVSLTVRDRRFQAGFRIYGRG